MTVGVLGMRSGDLGGFLRSLGIGEREEQLDRNAASWNERLVFAYIGGRIFLDQPVLGTGWHGQLPPEEYVQYLDDARERFPDLPANYFPDENGFIPQQTYDQVLYELGLVGALLFLLLGALTLRATVQVVRAWPRGDPDEPAAYVPVAWAAALDVRAARRGALRRECAARSLLARDRARGRGAFARTSGNVARVSRTVLVTGGAGFIGSNLVRALLERGDSVRVLDNFATGNRANLTGLEDDVDVVEGELRSYERVHNAVRGVELVFHQGALPSVPRSVQDPLTTSAVTIEGTLNVLLAARDESVRRVVFASSSSVYGNSGTPAAHRDASSPTRSRPYAVAKLAAERYCVSFHRVYDLETVALRYFNVFGPRQDPKSQYAAVVPRFLEAIDRGEPVPIHGDGTQSRDFTYVANVVEANLLAADREGAGGTVLNIATGRQASVNELADAIGAVLGKPVEKQYLPVRTGDVRDSWADVGEAKRVLGYETGIGLEDGLRLTARRTSSWLRLRPRGALCESRRRTAAGFLAPLAVRRPDCQPSSVSRRSSRSRNQMNMSIRGCRLAIP